MRFEHEATPVGVDERMALAPIDLLSSIVTARAAGLGGLDALAVDDRGGGAGVAPDPCNHERVVYPFKAPVVAPDGKPAVNRPTWRQVAWHQPPRAARPHDIEDAVDDLAHRPLTRPAHRAGLRQVRRDHAPLCVGQIGLVSGDGAAMLLSSGWRPHGEFKVGSRNPLESRGAITQPFAKTAADKSPGGLNLDIDGWLCGIGLAQYAEMFRANDIDVSVLRHLTDVDLEKLGVSLGHRRKILAAIAELAGAAPTLPQPALTEPKPQDTAERRQVTVMFSDLVGSTALSARMDPEDLREVISAYQKCVAETVRRFDGFVAKYMGDGVLVYFGYPQAHEDDAERTVRAGLEIVAAITALKSSVPLQTRVGIATGLVVVGDLIGSGEAQERGIVGETPNLAARLQGIAEPNMVVIAEATRKLLGNLFEFEDLGPRELKGIAGPVRAWAPLRPSSAEGRFEALHASGLKALVGREEELELLLRRWSRAKTGEGQVVLLSGEAGIGKSRLTAALLERLATEPHTRLRYFCSPQHTDSAFYPIIGQMERATGLAYDDTPQQKLDKLDALLAQTATSQQEAALFADMLSLPNDGRYPALELTAQQHRQKTLEAFGTQLVALARQSPVLVICEDVHWADPTSLEAFSRAVDRIQTVCGLLIMTFRPEFQAPWVGQPHVTALTLN